MVAQQESGAWTFSYMHYMHKYFVFRRKGQEMGDEDKCESLSHTSYILYKGLSAVYETCR